MKKSIVKAIVSVLVVGSLISVKANAETYNVNLTNFRAFTSSQEVYANSSQWKQINGQWMLATSDSKQVYHNTWASVNGQWYFLDDYGYMLHDQLSYVGNNCYYFTSSGAMAHDAYVSETVSGVTHYINSNGIVDLN